MEQSKYALGSIHKLKYGIYKTGRLKFDADSEIEILGFGPKGYLIKSMSFDNAQTLTISDEALRSALA